MPNILDYIKRNKVYLVFLLVGMLAVGYIEGIRTVIMLTLFLLLFTSSCYTILSVYNYFKGVKVKDLFWWSLISVVLSLIVYFINGSYLLIRIISLSSIVSLTILVYSNIASKSK